MKIPPKVGELGPLVDFWEFQCKCVTCFLIYLIMAEHTFSSVIFQMDYFIEQT